MAPVVILRDGFSGSQMVDLDGEWEVEGSVDDYDYHEDSDLEELEEEEMNTLHLGNGSVHHRFKTEPY